MPGNDFHDEIRSRIESRKQRYRELAEFITGRKQAKQKPQPSTSAAGTPQKVEALTRAPSETLPGRPRTGAGAQGGDVAPLVQRSMARATGDGAQASARGTAAPKGAERSDPGPKKRSR